MTDASAVAEAPANEAPQEDAAPDRTEAQLFKFSDFIHVGEGSAECEHRIDGLCKDPDHFHCWIRLPNKFQVVQMKEKGQAARARVMRQARDSESDRHAIVENEIAEAIYQGEEAMVAELMDREAYKHENASMRELVEEEDSPWATIEEDQVRWNFLNKLDLEKREEDAVEDEYQELSRHLAKWNEAVAECFEKLVQPERESLSGRTKEELAELMREIVINEQADQIFMRVYTKWQMVVCVLKPRGEGVTPKERVFDNMTELEAAAPEVIAAVEVSFRTLELEFANRTHLRAEGN